MKDRVLVGYYAKALLVQGGHGARRLREQFGLPRQVADAPVPAAGVAVGREQDQRVAREPALAEGRREGQQLGGALEVPRRLQVAQGPAWRHRSPTEQRRGLVQGGAQVVASDVVQVERGVLGGELEPGLVPRIARIEPGAARGVEEQAVALVREQERDGDIGAGTVIDVAVPQAARGAEPVEGLAALAQTVEVLLADDLKMQADLRAQRGAVLVEAQLRLACQIA